MISSSQQYDAKNRRSATKGGWSEAEDDLLFQIVEIHGPLRWSYLAAHHFTGKTGKQCRDRWHNQLNPSINHRPWTHMEEMALLQATLHMGHRWSQISKTIFPGRTANGIKNHYNSKFKPRYEVPSRKCTTRAV